jgi:spermidine/putrescine transport system permease protein
VRRRLGALGLAGPGTLWLAAFFLVPMAFMGVVSLESGSIDEGFVFDWSFGNYADAVSTYQTQFLRSFGYGAAATVLALLIAYPLAYAIAFRVGRWKPLLLFAVVAPFFTTYLIRTLAWQTILSDQSPPVDALRAIGLIGEDGRALDTSASVIAGLTYNFLPFMLLPIYANLERLDGRLVEAAQDLYSSSREAFLRVTLPLSAPGILAGVLLTFIPAVGDYVNAYFLGGPNQAMIGNVIQGQFLNLADYPTAAALSFTLMALIMIAVVAYFRGFGTAAVVGDDDAAGGQTAHPPPLPPPASTLRGRLRERALAIYALLATAYMLIPIAVIALFSFNDPAGNFNTDWQGFTLEHWRDPFDDAQLTSALGTSLELAVLVTLIATVLGTMLALALVRHRFRGRRTANVLILVPMATPEVVIGAALLSMFVYIDLSRGFGTLLVAHVMFSISFVVVVVRARLIALDPGLEEAAADLGAAPFNRFRTVMLPLLWPGVIAGAALAFALSIDDFVISNFNSGTTVTFPLYIFGASQRGIRPDVNVLATMLFALTIGAVLLAIWQQRRAERRLERVKPDGSPAPTSDGLYPSSSDGG